MGLQPAEVLVKTNGDLVSGYDMTSAIWRRRLFLALSAIVLIYAFLAGLRTISDPDSFWQLATGRWVAQHHQCLFHGSLFLHGAGTAVDLSRWLLAVSVLDILDRRICAVVVGWCFGLRRDGRAVAAPRLRRNCGRCHCCGDDYCGANRTARRHVHGGYLRGVSVATLGKLPDR